MGKVMIKTDGNAEVFPVFQMVINNTGPINNAANRDIETVAGHRNAPTRSTAKHTKRGEQNCPSYRFHLVGRSTQKSKEKATDKAGDRCNPLITLHRFHFIGLGLPDFLVNLSDGFAICGPDNLENGVFLPSHCPLNGRSNIHIFKDNQSIAPITVRLYFQVRFYGLGTAVNDKACKR